MAGRGSDGREITSARNDVDETRALRTATLRAILELSGVVGYRGVTVAAIVERSGSNRTRFYNTFGGKAECYTAAYAEMADELLRRLLRSAAGRDWRSGTAAALSELARFVEEDPDLARGLIAEVHVAGGGALVKRGELVARLATAVDGARSELERCGSRHAPPAITSSFIVTAIESALIRALLDRRSPRPLIPGFLYLAVAVYFGSDAARQAAERYESEPGER